MRTNALNLSRSVAAVGYVRTSTGDQERSQQVQEAAINSYAALHGWQVTRTYSDLGRSGLSLKRRPGLRQLLADITSGETEAAHVLVYDVSRWGRFQDSDESAHYEYLCKKSGATVHYCAEPFADDSLTPNLPNGMLRVLKRAIAAEYVRELSAKVFKGQARLAASGFWVGGQIGIGLRRKVVSADGRRTEILERGQRKPIKFDKMLATPGPLAERRIVQDIYRRWIRSAGRKGFSEIARDLEAQGVPYPGKRWTRDAVAYILTCQNYVGNVAWGKSSQRLGSRKTEVPREQWICYPHAFPGVVRERTFERAQALFGRPRYVHSDKQLLHQARRIYLAHGCLQSHLLKAGSRGSSKSTFNRRFGSLNKVCSLLHLPYPENVRIGNEHSHRTKSLRSSVLRAIQETFTGHVTLRRERALLHPFVRVDNAYDVDVVVCPCHATPCGELRWMVQASCIRDASLITLLCLLDRENARVSRYVMISNIWWGKHYHAFAADEMFRAGRRLRRLEEFYAAACAFHDARTTAEGA